MMYVYVCIFVLHVILYVCTRLHAYDGVLNVLCSAPRVRMPRCPRPSHLLALLLKQMLKFIRSPLWVEECVFIMYTLIIQVKFHHVCTLHLYLCVCMRACVCAYTRQCLRLCVSVSVCLSVCACMCVFVWIYVCVCACVRACVRACVCVLFIFNCM